MFRQSKRPMVAESCDFRPRLLVLDDDPLTRTLISLYFSAEGFHVTEAGSAAECRLILKNYTFDLAFVDVQLPDANGINFAGEIIAGNDVGIIFVTQRDSEIDRVFGLESVGDDYVTKPFSVRELMARSRSLLRRRKQDRPSACKRSVVTFGHFVMDLTRRELATKSAAPIALTRGEFDLLAALVEARGRPLYRDYLAEVVSSRTGDLASPPRSVDTLVGRLRRKLIPLGGEHIVITVNGIGYRFGMSVTGS